VTGDDLRIFVDATRPVTLDDGVGSQTGFRHIGSRRRCLAGAALSTENRGDGERDWRVGLHCAPDRSASLVIAVMRPTFANDHLDSAPQQQLPHDQAGLDRLAETDVISDQKVDARQVERLGKRQELVGVQPNTRPEGSLWIRRCRCRLLPFEAAKRNGKTED
jgi:hypothetical protein